MPFQHEIAHTPGLLNDIPKDEWPEDECQFWKTVAAELRLLIENASRATSPCIIFNACRKAGTQYIWQFEVRDLAIQPANTYNWHGQDTSQWLYAGAIVLQAGRVSSHH